MSNIIELVGALGGGAAITAAGAVLVAWLRGRSSSRSAAAREQIAQSIRAERVEVAREQGAAAVVGPLLERVEALEGRLDRCEEERETIATAAREAEEACRRRTDALEARVEDLREELAARDEEVTRRVRVAVDEAVRRTTPPGAWRPDPAELAAGRRAEPDTEGES